MPSCCCLGARPNLQPSTLEVHNDDDDSDKGDGDGEIGDNDDGDSGECDSTPPCPNHTGLRLKHNFEDDNND